RHVEDGGSVGVDRDAVHEAEVDDVDAELGVDHVAHRLGDVVERLRRRARVGLGHRAASVPAARAAASVNAIQPSSAHLTLAGYPATPANAIASSSRSSSTPSVSPRLCISVRNSSWATSASPSDRPVTRSDITDVDACEIEHPRPSWVTSATVT